MPSSLTNPNYFLCPARIMIRYLVIYAVIHVHVKSVGFIQGDFAKRAQDGDLLSM